MNDTGLMPPQTTVPSTHAERLPLWVRSSQEFGLPIDAYVMLAIQQLGQAEDPLLAMEDTLAQQYVSNPEPSIDQGIKLMKCSALSQYWVFGLYEMLRTSKQAAPALFAPVRSLFQKVEVARMPLAKHEVKSAPGYRNVPHYPTGLWSPETGQDGWQAFDPLRREMMVVSRTALADEFLSLTGLEGRDQQTDLLA